MDAYSRIGLYLDVKVIMIRISTENNIGNLVL
jgi:hypothetical protein